MATAYVKADVRRGQLIAAARRVLGRQGMAGGTLRAVAAEAGVALGTVHYVFPSKEQLLRAVLEDVVEEISDIIRDAAGNATDVESGILAGARTVWSRVVEPNPEQQLMQYELSMWALRTAGMTELAQWQFDRYLDLLTTHWDQLAAAVGVTYAVPTDQLARLQLAGADGLLLQYLVTRDSERFMSDLEALFSQLVRYAAPEPVTATRQPAQHD